MSRTLASVAVACVLLAASAAEALDPQKHVTQYSHASWRIQDGSLPAGMFSIAQTADGFLWVLSLPGDVYRFDGIRFVQWTVPQGPSGKIFADSTGLWVVWKEFVRLDGRNVVTRVGLKGLHGFQSISADADGSLWVGLRGQDEPLCNVKESRARCFGTKDGIPLRDVNAIVPDGHGGLWVGGPTVLVHWRPGGSSERYPVRAPISSLALTRDGTLWAGLLEQGPGRGLQRLRDGALEPFATPRFDGTTISVTSLLVDRDGNLWVATDAGGVVRIAGDGVVERYRETDGLSGDSVWALFEDREGIVWAGTTSGLDRFRDSPVVTFSTRQGLGKDLAAGIRASSDGTVWVANNGSLDRIRNGNVTSIRTSDGLPGNQVAAMLEDRAGNMWVGVDDALYVYKDGRFRRLPVPDPQPLGMVHALAEDIDGNVWASCGGPQRKLLRIRDFQVREVFRASQVPAGSSLAADPRGGIWIATTKGDVVLMRNGAIQTTVPLDPRSSPLNRHIVVGTDGSVLIGSENGLLGWRGGRVQRMTMRNGLPCDFVITFVQDKDKRWWLYTRCGIVRLSDADLQKWWANPDATVTNRVYDALDGAQPNIGSFNAAASTSDGRVWFSNGVVVQMLDPARIVEPLAAATASIDSVVVDRKEVARFDDLRIGPHAHELQIDYTSPTLSVPQKVAFRYKLDDYDDSWHDAGPRRQAFYTDVPPGTYTFRVMSANSAGVWNEGAATLTFSVVPAYYQTAWFRALVVVLLMALLWSAYQWRVRLIHERFELTLDARVSERTRIARELHDTLLQSFQGALLRFQSVANVIKTRPVEASERLERALDQAEAAITEGRNAVQGLRASATTVNDLANGIAAIGSEFTADPTLVNAPAITVGIDGESRDLNPLVRDEAYRIAGEALRNAIKHARARRVTVTIHYEPRQLRLVIHDDGKGIDAETLARQHVEGHFGLPGMHERAAVVNGSLDVRSKIGEGTEIELRVAAAVAYARSARSPWWSRTLQ